MREEVLGKIRRGQKVPAVAQAHGLNVQTIRNWLEPDTGGHRGEIMEVSRLRRENETLPRMVGQLTYESEVQRKDRQRANRCAREQEPDSKKAWDKSCQPLLPAPYACKRRGTSA